MTLKCMIWLPLLTIYTGIFAQQTLQAVRINNTPKVDGNLDDAAWINAPTATNFIQHFPNVGAPATHRSELKIVYDNNAIYVGAYLFDDPALIRKQLTARDDEQQTDVDFFLFLILITITKMDFSSSLLP